MLFKAIKVIFITEKLITKEICGIIETSGATGYTLTPAGGKGVHHMHPTSEKATVVDDFSNIKIEVIVKNKEIAEEITDKVVAKYFNHYSGITYLEEVEIHRPEKFSV